MKKHKWQVTAIFREIISENAKNFKDHKLISGNKLCCKCYKKLNLMFHSDILAGCDATYQVEDDVSVDQRLNKLSVH